MPPVLVEIKRDGDFASLSGVGGDTNSSGVTSSGNSCFVSAIKGGVEDVRNENGLQGETYSRRDS